MAALVTVTAATADIEALFSTLVSYVNSYGANGITMELRQNTEPVGQINNPVNAFTSVGRVLNFTYVAPTALAFSAV